MTTRSFDRHIHINYRPEFVEIWNDAPQEIKNICENMGEPYGYSGQNVFYFVMLLYACHSLGNLDSTFFCFKRN